MKYLEIRAGENPIYIGPEKRNARKLDEKRLWTDSKLGIQNASLNDL